MHNKQVQIAVRFSIAARLRPEHDNLFGVNGVNDSMPYTIDSLCCHYAS